MILRTLLLTSALALALQSFASAAIITSGGGITLVQAGGIFDANNLAAGTTPFAPNIEGQDPGGTPSQPTGYGGVHTTTGVVDLAYGNTHAWLAGSPGSYIGLNLGGSKTIRSIAYGRDNTGGFGDRALGLITFDYTTDAVPSLTTSNWITVGTMDYNANPPAGAFDASNSVRHRFDFTPINATGIRLVAASSGRGIEEIELYNSTITPVTLNGTIVQDEVGHAAGLNFQGAPIPTEPAPGDGQYHHANGPGTFTWSPNLIGTNVKVSASWGVSFNHSQDVDFFFDPDGPGPLAEIALSQNVKETLLADQTTTPGGVVWSGFYQIGAGLNLTAASVFRVTGTNVVGGSAPEALASAVWQFSTVPEPSSFVLAALAAGFGLVSVARRKKS